MSTALILHDVQTLSHMVVAVWVPEKRFWQQGRACLRANVHFFLIGHLQQAMDSFTINFVSLIQKTIIVKRLELQIELRKWIEPV